MSAEAPAIEVRGLTVAVGDRVLLQDASFSVAAGEVVLLVGLSGSGKSVTMRLLLGLLDRVRGPFRISGDVLLFGEDARTAALRRAGCVFQDFGLFDEWTAWDNIAFGFDHRRRKDGAAATAKASRREVVDGLIAEFKLADAGRVATLSGGMKQRCAIARTLAYDPDVLLYDEPTSGLDPAMSAQVARRIRATNDEHDKTSFVVTHDLGALAEVADRIILLDPASRSFRETAKDEIDAALRDLVAPRDDGAPSTAPRPARRLLDAVRGFLVATGRAVEATVRAALALVPRWPRLAWGLRYLWYYVRLSTVGSALAYVAVAGFILGLIVTYFTFSFLPFKEYTEPLLIDRVIGAIGYALYRIMVPGMVAMLVAARSGAAIAADIGNRVYTRQIDALQSFGVRPGRYFLTNILIAHLIGVPLLVAVNFLSARFGSLLVFAAIHPEHSVFFWRSEFERFLLGDAALYLGSDWLLGKSIVSGLGAATIAYFLGRQPKQSGRDVAGAVTRAIIWSTLFVLLVQLASALLEFDPI